MSWERISASNIFGRAVCSISVPWPGSEPEPHQWKPAILTTRCKLQVLACCSPWGRQELDTTEWLHFPSLEKEMATHSSILAWRIAGTAEPGGLPSLGSHSRTWLKRRSSNMIINTFEFTLTHTLTWQCNTIVIPRLSNKKQPFLF